jgi:catechol 2,3-dioxygenase-like lactoylglutathione lyase family enzyme
MPIFALSIQGLIMKFNALVPELSVSDINKSLGFYVDVLGFKIEYQRMENKFAFLSYGDAQLMIEQVNGNWNVAPLERPFG